MKVTRNTPQQLIIDHYSIFLAIMVVVFFVVFCGVGLFLLFNGVFLGLPFLLAGLFFCAGMLYFTERVQVILDRETGLITVRRRNILRYQEVTHDLQALDRAVVESSRSGKNNTETYRATLVLTTGMSAGHHPITKVYSNMPGSKEVVEAINNWLKVDGAQMH